MDFWIFVEFATATFGIVILSFFIFMTRPFASPFQRLSCNSKVSFFAHCVLHASLFVGYFSCHNFRVQCQVQFWKRALFAWSNYFTEYCFKTIPPSEVPYWAICTKTPLKKTKFVSRKHLKQFNRYYSRFYCERACSYIDCTFMSQCSMLILSRGKTFLLGW